MRILQATSEFFPYSKTGGLADMVAGLSGALAQSHKITVATPLYQGIREKFPDIKPAGKQFNIPMGGITLMGRWWQHQPSANLTVLLLENDAFYHRQGIYMEHGEGYWDNPERFIFFSKSVRQLIPDFDVAHLHDWQTAIVPMLQKEGAGESAARTVFTIHNLAYQGSCVGDHFNLTNLPVKFFHSRGPEHFGNLNFMKAGLHYADAITTVSPQYAQEILTNEFGEGLDGELLKRRKDLTGILNGVDYNEWRTINNPHLTADYDINNLSGKKKCKSELLEIFGLPEEGLPLMAVVSRLAEQKGIGQLVEVLSKLLPDNKFQFVLLGSGDGALEETLLRLKSTFPKQVGIKIGYDQALSHQVEAGADFFLMPSRFEPCGLNQLYSLRYGTIPIVHAVGGLKDSITDIASKHGNGISYDQFEPTELKNAIQRAIDLFGSPIKLNETQQIGMALNHSWHHAAEQYCDIYQP
jgi:starch synthase